MKKALGLLVLGLTGIAALASCGSTKNEVVTTTDYDITTVMEGFAKVDQNSGYNAERFYWATSEGSNVIEAQTEDKNATFLYHYESSSDGKVVTDNARRIINVATKDFYFEETYTESHDSKPDTPYSYSYKITGAYNEDASSWDCYIDYDIKNYEVEGEPELVYSPILDDYVESTTYGYLSESGHLKALNQQNTMMNSYSQFVSGGIYYLSYSVIDYYMNEYGDLQIISSNESSSESYYQYSSNGVLVKAVHKTSTYISENSVALRDAEEINMPDVSQYEKEISTKHLGSLYSSNNQLEVYSLADLILKKN